MSERDDPGILPKGGDHVITDVAGCARCGGDHARLQFARFLRGPQEDGGGVEWTHWSACPVTGDPILMRIEATDAE